MKYSGAVAVVEVAGLPTAIACADAMVKAANVTLIGYEITRGGPGMVNVKIYGDVGAVQAAVDAGCAVANQITEVCGKVIMPRPHTDLEKILLNRNTEAFFARMFDTVTPVQEGAKVEAKVREEAQAKEETKTREKSKAEQEIKPNNETKPKLKPNNNDLPKGKTEK